MYMCVHKNYKAESEESQERFLKQYMNIIFIFFFFISEAKRKDISQRPQTWKQAALSQL